MRVFTVRMYTTLCITALCVLIESAILHQRYITSTNGEIPLSQVRADCQDGRLVSSSGQTLTSNDILDVSAVLAEDDQHCTPQAMTGYALKLKGMEIIQCYQDKECGGVRWSSADIGYTCGAQSMKLELDLYCEVSSLPDDTPTSAAVVPRSQQTCDNMKLMTASHVFLTSACAQPLTPSAGVLDELQRLKEDLNECLNGCTGVSLSTYSLSAQTICTPSTTTGTTSVRVYWTCAASSPQPTSRSVTTPEQPTTVQITPERASSAAHSMNASDAHTGNQETHTTTAAPLENGDDETGELSQVGNTHLSPTLGKERTYLIALVIVTVALVVVILLLVTLSVYVIKIKGRYRMQAKLRRGGPPSRQALYSPAVSETVRLCDTESRPTSDNSSIRYIASKSMEEAKVSDGGYSEYSVPLGESYNEPEEDDAYEIMDTELTKHSKTRTEKDSKQRKNSEKYSYGYMIPVKSSKSKTRTLSEKYSNGYLLPTAVTKSQ